MSQFQEPLLSTMCVDQPVATANCLLAALHTALTSAAIAHRALCAFHGHCAEHQHHHLLLLAADLLLFFLWALSQAFLWRPVSRSAFPGRLSRRALPAVDVLVVTADLEKEPTVEVMNTVVSAMALDYPGGRLRVYLSDDGGSPVTLLAARKAYGFARAWVPFCRKYRVRCPIPESYFAGGEDEEGGDGEFLEERLRIKNMYEDLRESIQAAKNNPSTYESWTKTRHDHDAYTEIITGEEGSSTNSDDDDDDDDMPLLVYVSREKRKTSPHHFKAGALNVLLRVSSVISNSPYVLVLDCDMHCNDRSSILQAMCFHLDRRLSPTLAFVQFPQKFHNLSKSDIYTGELRAIFSTRWKGLDGVRGPMLSGSGFYIRRDALYGASPGSSSVAEELFSKEVGELKRRFGLSNDLITSLRTMYQTRRNSTLDVTRDASLVASCAYETDTKWGKETGFLYDSVVEDYFTGYQLHCRGWTSAYCYPTHPSSRAPFLGSTPTNLNDVLVQNKRWMSGLLSVALSKYCPLIYTKSIAVSIPQSMCYAFYAFITLYALPLMCYAIIPQLCFFRGVSLFPKVSSPWFAVLAAVFMSSLLQHLIEVSVAKRTLALRTWWNEQRFWMINAVTGQLFACQSVFLKLIGAGAIDFELTNKASDDKLYQDGVFYFGGCSTLLLPATTLCMLNVTALLTGTWKMNGWDAFDELFAQFFLLCYIAALSYPLLEGMFLRQDPGRVPARITAWSVALAAVLLLFG